MLRLALLIPVVWVLYTWQIDQAPVHLSHDEVLLGLNAHAIASTGHDLSGQALPIFFTDRSPSPGKIRCASISRRSSQSVAVHGAHDQGRMDRIYVSLENPFIQDYVQFYTIKHSREDLRERIEYREPRATDPPRALVVRQVAQESARRAACTAPIPLNLMTTIREPDGSPSFILCGT